MSTRHTGIILGMNAGEIMPLPAYQAAAKGQNMAGFALVKEGKLRVFQNGEPFTDEEFMKWQEDHKEFNRLLFLGAYPEDYSEKDCQPFVLTRGENKEPTSIVMIEGDYSNLHQPEEAVCDEYQLVQRVINPILNKYIADSDDPSPQDFIKQTLGTKELYDKINNANAGRGVVVFMTDDGTVSAISKNDLKLTAGWGSMSQSCGYSEGTFPKETEAPADGVVMKRKKKMVAEDKSATPAPAPAEPAKETAPAPDTVRPDNKEGPVDRPINKPGDVVVPDLQTAVFQAPEGKLYFRPNKGLSNSEQKSTYHQVGGFTPSKNSGEYGWDQRPWMLGDAEKVIKWRNKVEIKDENAFAAALAKARSNKDTTVHSQVDPNIKRASNVAIIPDGQMDAFRKTYQPSKEVQDAIKGPVISISQITKWEEDHPDFTKKTGLTLEQAASLPYFKKVELCSQYHFLAALLIQSMGNEIVKLKAEKPSATSVPATGKTDQVVAEQPVKRQKKMAVA
jgi:hypothetical protein